jgi:hypothetical protein
LTLIADISDITVFQIDLFLPITCKFGKFVNNTRFYLLRPTVYALPRKSPNA